MKAPVPLDNNAPAPEIPREGSISTTCTGPGITGGLVRGSGGGGGEFGVPGGGGLVTGNQLLVRGAGGLVTLCRVGLEESRSLGGGLRTLVGLADGRARGLGRV